eukprot:2723987-Amphidinium_carterae.1
MQKTVMRLARIRAHLGLNAHSHDVGKRAPHVVRSDSSPHAPLHCAPMIGLYKMAIALSKASNAKRRQFLA